MAKKQSLQEYQQPPATEIVIMAEALTAIEYDELVEHEKTISRGLHTFIEVGEALQEIRDKRLYRTEFQSFEGYCKLKWGMGSKYAYRLIGGAEVAGNLVSSIGDTALPAKEAHTRELSKLAPEAQPVAWLKAVQKAGSAEAVTAEIVARAVDEVLGKVGRFDPKLWYAYDGQRKVIYEPGVTKWGGDAGHEVLEGFGWKSGNELNSDKQYDGCQLLPIPKLDAPPITDSLPGINLTTKQWGDDAKYYPVNARKKTIYNDPVNFEERGEKRYPNCEFMREYNVAREWASLKLRMFEYRIMPAEPTVDWTKDAHLQPGKFIRCYKCGTEHPFEEMVAGVHGEFWICPHGQIIRDEAYRIREQQSAPAVQSPIEPQTDANAPDDDEDIDGDAAELWYVLEALTGFDEFLTVLADNIDDFDTLLNQRQDIIDTYEQEESEYSAQALPCARKLLELMQGWSPHANL